MKICRWVKDKYIPCDEVIKKGLFPSLSFDKFGSILTFNDYSSLRIDKCKYCGTEFKNLKNKSITQER